MKERSLSRLFALAALTASVSACDGDAKSTTGGERVVLETRVEPSPSIADELTTGTKWKVKLGAARLAVGALYYFDGKPALAMNQRRRSPLQHLGSYLVGTAYAHPQHYVAGNALGEMVEPSSVDLFRGGAVLAPGEGVTGTFRSGRVVLPKEVVGPAAGALGGHVAMASGVATKDARTVYFTVTADLQDIQETSPQAEIDGCVFEEVEVTTDGTVTLTVTPSVWFNLVDFSGLESGTEEAPTELTRGDKAHKAFALGVAQLSAYRFEYTP